MVIIVILGLLLVVFCISMAIKTSNYQKELQEQKRREEEERQRRANEEKERREKLLRKAETISSTHKSKLEAMYKELESAQISYALSIGSTMLSIQAAYQPVKKHDPYIRGGMASAIGGPALGVYTALKTDEENRRNEEAHNEAQERLVQKRNKEFNAKLNYEKIGEKIANLEERIEKELDMLNKASQKSHEYYSELKSLYDKNMDVDNSLEYYHTKPYSELTENEHTKYKELCKIKHYKLSPQIKELEEKINT